MIGRWFFGSALIGLTVLLVACSGIPGLSSAEAQTGTRDESTEGVTERGCKAACDKVAHCSKSAHSDQYLDSCHRSCEATPWFSTETVDCIRMNGCDKIFTECGMGM